MEFFNFVETFFFVSLAITFVLIMMLVYHFKERLTIVEKKTNTMFDIITNIVNELNGMRNHPVSDNKINEQIFSGTSNVPLSTLFSQIPTKIVVSENEDEEEEEDDETTDDEENDDEDDEETKIKIINIDLQANNENNQFEELNESGSSTDEDEELYNNVTDFEAYSNMESEKPESNEVELSLSSSSTTLNEIKVEKSNKTTNEELTNSYRKMDINALRNLVVEKGIQGDIKKLKKIELIRLLDANA